MISKEQLLDYIEGSTPKIAKQLALTMGAMLNEKQLEVLSRRFETKYEFNPKLPKKEEKKPSEEELDALAKKHKKERVPTPSQTMPKEIAPDVEDELDFDLDDIGTEDD